MSLSPRLLHRLNRQRRHRRRRRRRRGQARGGRVLVVEWRSERDGCLREGVGEGRVHDQETCSREGHRQALPEKEEVVLRLAMATGRLWCGGIEGREPIARRVRSHRAAEELRRSQRCVVGISRGSGGVGTMSRLTRFLWSQRGTRSFAAAAQQVDATSAESRSPAE